MKLKYNEKRHVNLTEGSIVSGIIYFAIPLLLSNFLQQLYNTADLMIVGQFAGKDPMAAVGATAPIANLLIGLFIGLTTGASVVVSQLFGAMDRIRLKRAIHTAYAIAIAGGAIISILGITLSPWMLGLLNTPASIMDKSLEYMRIFFIGMIPLLVYNMGASILRSVGDSRRPFNFLLVAALVNIVLDLVLVAFFKMSVVGAGLATVTAQVVSAVLVTLNLSQTTAIFKLDLKEIKFYRESLSTIFKIGIPTGISTAVISFSNVVIQGMINVYGANAIAGAAAESRIDGFIFMGLDAIALGATTFAAQNYGAGKMDRFRSGLKVTLGMVAVESIVLGLIGYIFAEPLITIFNGDPEVVDIGVRFLRTLSWAYVFLGANQVIGGFIRGTGEAVMPMAISVFGMCIFRLILLYFGMKVNNSIDTIFISYPITWIVTGAGTGLYYKFGNWRVKGQ
ncbi:MATE family efflux transporter [Peptoniphilus equinus]|uniref:MATE family efflux transporter n=1 Tax=Peptoniphilus equinus TaxID=3016343 RepID=A0ABY7QVA1_9FIRM|nr:MATE family efflux transporter [Peptoniphilus equinus]WBW50009.1 MATE family efflux transporter [Peptoniphilus equinus]